MIQSFILGLVGALLYSALFFAQANTMHKASRSYTALFPLRLIMLALCIYTGYYFLDPFVIQAYIGGIIAGFCSSLALGYYLHSRRA